MFFDVVGAVDRYQAASEHMRSQTISPAKIGVLVGLVLFVALLVFFFRKK